MVKKTTSHKLYFIFKDKLRKSYKFEDLEELQNILMLVAPRKSKNFHRSTMTDQSSIDLDGQEDESETLEYFIEIFSSVIRLAEIYLKLANHSCLFFENFIAKVYCDLSGNRLEKTKEPCLVLFNLNNFFDIGASMSNLENKTDTLSALNSLCSILDETYEIWCTYIDLLRDKYNYLNYFTITQIKYLYTNLNKLIIENVKGSKQTHRQAEEKVEFEIVSFILYNLSSKLSMEKILFSYEQTIKMTSVIDAELIQLDKLNLKNENSNNETFYQKYKQAWSSFINEQNALKLIKAKHLSFKQLIILLDVLSKNEKINSKTLEIKRKIPGYLNTRGKNSFYSQLSLLKLSILHFF